MPVRFFSEDVLFSLKNKRILASWIKAVAQKNKHEAENINIVFCSDPYLSELNKSYLNHHTLTDIITFPYSSNDAALISGDIFISIDRVKDNACKYGVPFTEELHRVIIHGVLHLCGQGDKTKAEKSNMRAKEEESLNMLEEKLKK